MTAPRLLFVGGNGHARARLDGVREVLARPSERPPFLLVDVALPGFEGRPAPASLEDLTAALAEVVQAERDRGEAALYATGIGALLTVTAALEGKLPPDLPLIAQGAVLWGLERRRFPRLMRALPGASRGLGWLLRMPAIQRRFVRRHFRRALDDAERGTFFSGYAACPAFGRFFEWFTPAHLRRLEAWHAEHPERLDGLRFLWGARDSVVSLEEVDRSEAVLARSFTRRVLAEWGHYPMIDDPVDWVREVGREVADALCYRPVARDAR